MNRRDFLKSLAALGAAFTIPLEALAVVSDAVIDDVWQEAIDDPMTFHVNEWRTISADAAGTSAVQYSQSAATIPNRSSPQTSHRSR